MSSAILYLAIVAIWAGVLIPRWLRHDAGQERTRAPAVPRGTEDDLTADGSAGLTAEPTAGPARPPETSAGAEIPGVPGAARADRRARVLSARRRMLAMLLVLVAGAMLIAAARLAAWWVVVPPALMLTGYLGLLREAARADAERDLAEHTAAMRAHRDRLEAARAAQERAASEGYAAPRAPAAGWPDPDQAPSPQPAAAEVLDISARVAEEPYDQYADAKLRAVGD